MTALRRSVLACLLAVAACTADAPTAPPSPSPSPTASPSASPSAPVAATFDADHVVEDVRYLAGLGPRETTSAAYGRAVAYVRIRLQRFGYRVRLQRFRVPSGTSNREPVPSGETSNVIAVPPGFDPSQRHIVVGAHLDTVPQAPGAVDNAAGVGIMLELAWLAELEPTPLPVVFVAFAAEESRGKSGGLRGSRTYVQSLTESERRAISVMVSVDRVGTGTRVPVCVSRQSARPVARRFLEAARRVAVPAYECTNGSSDHASFSAAGIPAVRIGPDSYPEYHTSRDVPSIFVPPQAARAGELMWEVLHTGA